MSLPAQGGVGLRRAVARDDVQGVANLELPAEAADQVEQPGIDGLDLVGAVVAQDLIDGRQGVGEEPATLAVGAGQAFAGVRVEQAEAADLLTRRGQQGSR